MIRPRGNHRQFKHLGKPGLVAVSGDPGHELAAGALNGILKQAGLKEYGMKYLIVIEPTGTGFSAVSTGAIREEVERNMQEAIELHVEGLREEECPVPELHTSSAYVEVTA